jgi:hypothetical protein
VLLVLQPHRSQKPLPKSATLLPKLISDALQVPKAEKFIEEVI